MRTNKIIIRLKIYIQKFINRGKANNLGHSFTYMGKVSTKLNISHKSLLVVSLGLVTGELYLLDLKIYINVSFILSGLNWPVLSNKALSSVISSPFLPFKYNTFPPSSTCINSSGYSTPLYGSFPQYFMLYWAWQCFKKWM